MNWGELTWEVLSQPAWMGAVMALITIVFFMPIVEIVMVWIPDTIPGGEEQRKRIRGVFIVVLSLGLAMLMSFWRMDWIGRDAVPLALAAFALGVAEYEVVKNVVGAFGGKIPTVRY